MLRAIALKLSIDLFIENSLFAAEIIMLRAIALKRNVRGNNLRSIAKQRS